MKYILDVDSQLHRYYLWGMAGGLFVAIEHRSPIIAFSKKCSGIWYHVKDPILDKKNSQYFEAKNGRPIFDKIFDAILPAHVPSKFWSKFIVLKMFDPDAAVAVALVLAKCSPEDWIFDQNFDPQMRQNIEELSKYWRLVKNIKQVWSVNILSQCIFGQKNLPHMVKNPVKILMSIFCFNILTDFL